jgi:ribose transport system permease protein
MKQTGTEVAPTASEQAGGPVQRHRWTVREIIIQASGIGTFYVIVLIFFSFEAKNFLTYSNFAAILAAVAVLGIVSIGQVITIISGGFDLSVSGTLPLGAVAYAELVNHGINFILATLLVILIGCVVGLVNGFLVARLGINPMITTLGTLSIAGGLAYTITNGLTLPFTNMAAGFWGNNAFASVQWGVVALVVLAVIGFVVLRFTVYGRSLYALGGNREASRLAGISVIRLTGSVYVICGACAALAGVVTASQLLAGSPTVGVTVNLSSITAVILGGAALTGGVGGVPGTMLGVLLLGTISDGMALMQVQTFYQEIATGAVLLVAVGFSRLRSRFAGTA